MPLRLTCLALAALSLCLHAPSALADDYTPLFRANKYDDITRLTNAALAKDPVNAGALIAKARLLAVQAADTRIDEAVRFSQQCVAAHPKRSECYESLGNMLGAKAVRSGIMSAISSAPSIRDAFKTAVELDPKNMGARFSLLQYYMQAPGVVGGGADKAKALAADTAKLNPEGSKTMLALMDLMDNKSVQAEDAALKVQPNGNEAVEDMQRSILVSLAWTSVKEKKYDEANRRFREISKRFTDSFQGLYGTALVLQEQGKHQDAITTLQQAAVIAPTRENDYHTGISWQALNEPAKALAAFDRALATKTGLNKQQKGDAEKRLKQLKG